MSNVSNGLLMTVPKLGAQKSDGTSTTFHDWKFAMEMVLRRAGCWAVLSEAKPADKAAQVTWLEKSEEAQTAIGLAVDPSQYQYISGAKDAASAWESLKGIHEKNSRANRIAMMRSFYNARHDSSKPIQEYITPIIQTATRLRAIGVKIDDSTIVDVLIMNLDEKWSNMAASLSTATKDNSPVTEVTGALIDEEGRCAASDPDSDGITALVGKARKAKYHPNINCYRCGKKGHTARHCEEELPKKGNTATTAAGPDTATIAYAYDYAF